MAWTPTTNAYLSWYLAYRNGGAGAGTTGTALVSDLQVNDYLVGCRSTVMVTGSTVSGSRSLTLRRPGFPDYVVSWKTGDSVPIIRP